MSKPLEVHPSSLIYPESALCCNGIKTIENSHKYPPVGRALSASLYKDVDSPLRSPDLVHLISSYGDT